MLSDNNLLKLFLNICRNTEPKTAEKVNNKHNIEKCLSDMKHLSLRTGNNSGKSNLS